MYKVLILLAAYKGEKYIREQIDSILAQDCSDWHLVVSDDGNDTQAILDEYACKFSDKITHYKSGLRFGSAQKHFMHLLNRFSNDAEYFMFADQDDFWHSNKVKVTLDAMEEAEKCYGYNCPIVVHTNLRIVDSQLNETLTKGQLKGPEHNDDAYSLNHMLVFNLVTGCTMMINASLAKLADRDIPIEFIGMHDWWLSLLASAFGKIVYLHEMTMDYRQHGNNVVGSPNKLSFKYIANVIDNKKLKQFLSDDEKQAEALVKYYPDLLTEYQKNMLGDFTNILNFSKLKRLSVYKKYDIYKPGALRKLEQILFW